MAVTYSYSPLGSEFLVNTNTLNDQIVPSVTGINNGGFVVTWTDESATLGDTEQYSVKGQVYDFKGTKVGAEFLVNTTTTGPQFSQNVTFLNERGGFVVSWIGEVAGDNDSNGVGAQVFTADGTKVGDEILVNTIINNNQNFADISFGGGGFVVAWTDNSHMSADTNGTGILAQRFTEAEVKVGPEFLANTTVQGGEEQSRVTGLLGGGFVITWVDTDNAAFGDSGIGIQAQVFNASGGKVGSEFLVNTSTAGTQLHPDITWLANGGFVVAWEDPSGTLGDLSGSSIKAQRFNADGTKAGTEFLVNTTTAGSQDTVAVATLPNGFVVSWHDLSNTAPDTSGAVRAQVYDLSGTPAGSEFLVNTNTGMNQDNSSLSLLTNGAFIAVWADQSQTLGDSSGYSVKGQLYQRTTTGDASDDSVGAPLGVSTLNLFGGTDTVTFSFNLTDATVTYSGNGVIVTTATSQTTVSGAEIFVFSDGTVNNNDGNPLVDDLYYYSHNLDVWVAQADAEIHYNSTGWHEGRDPNAFFSTSTYLSANADVKATGVNPLDHWHNTGWTEGRVPSIAFDPRQYLDGNPDVAAAHVDPLAHFLQHGAQENRQPFAPTELIAANGFDYVYYLSHNPDIAAAHVDPFLHFQTQGWKEGRNPNALFDVNGYLSHNLDVANANANPLDHYNTFGWHEGRDPSVGFDTTAYLAAYPDVAAANVNPLTHFLHFGIHEGRSPFADGVWG